MIYNLKTLSTIASGSIAALSFGGMVQAATINGSIGFIGVGGTSFTGVNLGAATVINFPNTNLVNLNDPTYDPPDNSILGLSNAFYDGNAGGSAGAFPVIIGSSVVINNDPFTLSPGLPFSVSFTAGGNPATFTASTFSRSSSGSNNLDLLFAGVVTGTGFDPSPAELSFAFTRTGNTNYSATLATIPVLIPPPPGGEPSVPEPGTLVGLLAVGTAGLVSRRRQS